MADNRVSEPRVVLKAAREVLRQTDVRDNEENARVGQDSAHHPALPPVCPVRAGEPDRVRQNLRTAHLILLLQFLDLDLGDVRLSFGPNARIPWPEFL